MIRRVLIKSLEKARAQAMKRTIVCKRYGKSTVKEFIKAIDIKKSQRNDRATIPSI